MTQKRWPKLAFALAVVVTWVGGEHLVTDTEAAWTDSEYVSATVGSGSWTTSGFGLGVAARVNSAGGVSILPVNPTPLPWNGARAGHDASNPGTSTVAGIGPFASSAVAGVNRLALSGSTQNTAVGAGACGSYTVGASGTPTYCTTGTPTAGATASVSSMLLLGSVVSLLEAVGLVNTNIVGISGAAQTISASVSCDLASGTNTVVQPKAGTGTGNGSVLVGNRAVAIPNANASATVVTSFADGLVGYSNVRLTSTASTPNSANGFARLNLTGSVSLLSLGLLPLTFDVDLISVQCGPGATPASATVAADQPMARVVPTTTTTPTSTTSATTTEPTTTTPTTTTEPTTTTPTTTTEPTTTTSATTTSEPPSAATVFTGPSDGKVTELTFDDGVTCTAEEGADYSGTVEFACDDASTISASGVELYATNLVATQGLWTPILTTGTARPVVSAQLTS